VPGVDISPGSAGELHVLFALAKRTFGDRPGWSDPRVLEILERDLVFVAHEQQEEPAGYVALDDDSRAGMVVVDQLLVAPGHERHGVGRRLLGYSEGYAIAQRVPALGVVVEERNTPARAFYRRAGFVPVERELLQLTLPRAD
jgi:ribosomal protein S18 acetylase RimI-like enzyme